MANYQKCIDRITRAAGKNLTPEQLEVIFSRIHKAALDLKAGRKPPKMSNKSAEKAGVPKLRTPAMDNVIVQSAQWAMVDMVNDAEVKLQQANLQVLKLNARLGDFEDIRKKGYSPLDAVRNQIQRNFKGLNVESLEQLVQGKTDYYRAKLQDTWKALGDDFLGFFQDPKKAEDLIREMRGEDTGDALAKQGAQKWLEAAKEMLAEFNLNGGDVRTLADWAFPQHHSQERAANAGNSPDPMVNMKAWVDAKMERIDRSRYRDDTDQPFTDERMRAYLAEAWDSIATDGIANLEAGALTGVGKVANRHAEHRFIHYKDAQSAIDDWREFGEKTLVEILDGHVATMARDIAFVEKFGPNPETTYRTLRDTALQDSVDRKKGGDPAKTVEMQGQAIKLDELWNYASGRTKASANLTLSNTADAIANLNVAGKLGGAMLASLFGDKVMYEAVNHLNNVPILKSWGNEIGLLNPLNGADRRLLERNGLMLDSVRSGLNRFYEGLGKSSFTGKLANAVMRITGMNAINEIRKGAFGLNMFSAVGHELAQGVEFGKLAESDVRLLRNWGITEENWKVWGLAKRVNVRGTDDVLLPTAIGEVKPADIIAAGLAADEAAAVAVRRNAVVKYLGAVNTESEFAVVTPGWSERSQFYGDLQRGTVKGEIARSFLQFKSFPWAYFKRNIDAIANVDGPAPRAAMVAALIVGSAVAGSMILQTREVLAGKDPKKMFDGDWLKFWGHAFLQGGALGIYGDFLYSANQNRYGSGILEAMAGPTLGPVLEMGLVQPMGAIRKKMEGKESHLAAQTLQDLKGFVPGGNIWYTKAALDHLIWQNVFETLSPGYLANIKSRTMKEYRQSWWWEPGEAVPERAPDFAGAFQ